jgi:hypothetical protein
LDADFWINLVKSQGVALMLVIWFIWFITFRAWPFYTTRYIQERNDQNALLGTMTNTLVEIKVSLENLHSRTEYIDEGVRELRSKPAPKRAPRAGTPKTIKAKVAA